MKSHSILFKIYQLKLLCFLSNSNSNTRDPPDICKRSVSELSWHVEGPTKLAVSYAISRFQQTPEKMRTNSYIWDLMNPNAP